MNPVKRQTLLARVVMRLKREGYDLTVLFIGGERDAQMTAELRSYNDEAIQLLENCTIRLNTLKWEMLMHFVPRMRDAYSLIEAIGVAVYRYAHLWAV